MVTPVEYLRWHEAHGGGEYDLATSDQQAVAGDWTVAPEVLADRSDPPESVTLAEQLATVYDVTPAQVLVTAGATQANVAAIATAIDEQDTDGDPDSDDESGDPRVLVEAPGYEPLRATPDWLGATVDRFRRPMPDGCPLSADRISAACVDETALVVTSNRHNPSGRRVDRETLADAAAAAREADARLLVDEVYAPFDRAATDGPFGGPSAAGLDDVVVTASLTKFFGLGGLRIGWLVADEAFVDRARRVLHHLGGVATPSEALARRALHHREALETMARDHLRENCDLLVSFVAERDDVVGPAFEGSTFAFLGHVATENPDDDEDGVELTDGDVVTEAAAAHGCTVVPGRFFEAPDRFRVSLGGRPEAMAASLEALDAALDDL